MKISKIKPIPQKILDKIYMWDCCIGPAFNINHNFFSYLDSNDGELVKVTVATRFVKDRWFCKQVAVHGVNSPFCFAKDIDCYFLGGYVVDWYNEGISQEHTRGTKEWDEFQGKYFDPFAPLINPEYALRFKKYKYSAADKYKGVDIIRFLRQYEKHPQVELFVKFGFGNLALSTQLLKKTDTDKKFRRWLLSNRERLAKRLYAVKVLLDAYKYGMDIDEMENFASWERRTYSGYGREEIQRYFDRSEMFKLYDYLQRKETSIATYMDYLTACDYLGLDVTKKQNRYPADFRKWHDIRTTQKRDIEARRRQIEKEEQLKNFANVVAKYSSLQYTKGKNYIAIIATCPEDLIDEGTALHHCVGRMGYDLRFAQEKSLIFFIRQTSNPDTPFVTVEYSLATHSIIQQHGDHNSKPDEATAKFIQKIWLPHANKQIRQLQPAA